MLTVIAGLIGLAGSFLPALLNYLTAGANNAYQLELIKLQIQAAASGTQLQIDLAQTKADIELQQSLYSYDNGPAGPFMDAVRASVRPVITYAIFTLWVLVEFVGFFWAIHQGKTITEIIPIIWDNNTAAIFMTVIGFWFGTRLLDKYAVFPPINQPKVSATRKVGGMEIRSASFQANTETGTVDDARF